MTRDSDTGPGPRSRTARTAGLALLVFTVLSVVHFTVIELNLIVSDGTARIAAFVESHEPLFRAGIVLDLLIFSSGTVFFVALYTMLRSVDETLALLALLWMLIQASLAVVIELSSFTTLLLFGGKAYLAAFEPDQLEALAGLVLATRAAGYVVTVPFFSLGFAVFCLLLFRSRAVPRKLAAWGLLSFSLLLVSATGRILLSDQSPMIAITRMASGVASVSVLLFQIVFGLWLSIRGVREGQEIP